VLGNQLHPFQIVELGHFGFEGSLVRRNLGSSLFRAIARGKLSGFEAQLGGLKFQFGPLIFRRLF
jgi:hypothetical protein